MKLHYQQKLNILLTLHNQTENFLLSLHYNGSTNFLFVNAAKIYHLKAKYSEIKKYPICLGNVSKDLTAINMKRKTEINGYICELPVDYNVIDTGNIIDIHKYFMKRYNIK